MSRRRALMMAAGGGAEIPTDSLVFHMSFRDSCELAETGQTFDYRGQELVYDETLGRNVGRLSEEGFPWDHNGYLNLPVGNAPFTVALKVKLREAGFGISPLIVWGTVPYGPTVAAFNWNENQGVCFSAWGNNKETRRVSLPYGEWHHLCGVNDGEGNPKFYFDGTLFDTASFDFDISSGDDYFDGLSFNSFWSPEHSIFDLANARIYNRALSGGEVAALAKEV